MSLPTSDIGEKRVSSMTSGFQHQLDEKLFTSHGVNLMKFAVRDYSPFYTSKVIRFQFNFNPHRTGFVPSTSNPVPIKSVSNRFESIHFMMWIQSGSKWIGDEVGAESSDSGTSHTTCRVWWRNGKFGVEKEETSALITVWGEDRVKTTINECKRNRPVHMKIAAENGLSEKTAMCVWSRNSPFVSRIQL